MACLISPLQAQTLCDDPVACNFTPSASQCIRVEAIAAHSGMVGSEDLTGMTTYRVFAVLENTDDVLSAIIGDSEYQTFFNSSTSFFQHPAGSATPNTLNPTFFSIIPALEFDSWVTIGIDQAPEGDEGSISIIEDSSSPWRAPFEAGNNLDISSAEGGGWYSFMGDSNTISGSDNEVLVGQFTTSGTLSGQIYMQIFLHGDSENEVRTLVNLADACGLGDSENCVYAPENYDCFGVCTIDTNSNGICDFDETGCTDFAACNYDSSFTIDDGSCDFCSCGGSDSGGLTFTTTHSQYGLELEPITTHTSGSMDGMTTYRLYLNMEFADDAATSFTGNDIFPLSLNTTSSFFQEPIFGGATPANISSAALSLIPDLAYDSWVTIGLDGPASSGESNVSLLPGTWASDFEDGNSFTVNDGVGSGWYVLPNVSNGVADENQRVLFAQLTTDGDISGSLSVQIFPHGDSTSDNRVDFSFSMANGSTGNACGCTAIIACNYDPLAQYDDGTCEFVSCLVFACTDAMACNYDPLADYDDGSCTYSNPPYDCDGSCINDTDDDGLCDEYEIPGCTDSNACNYASGATDDNGSCDFTSCQGCTSPFACNYDASASIDDGSCDFVSCIVFGCADSSACNYDPLADYDDGSCTYPTPPYDCDGSCINDTDGDGICNEYEIPGCTDSNACNYASGATDNDGSCDFTSCLGCTSPFACNYDTSASIDDGSCDFTSCIVFGCADSNACNYDPLADYDNGSCSYANFPYNCDGNCINDNNNDGVCDEFETFGCTDSTACNYSSGATDEDGSCTYDCYGCTDPSACNFDSTASIDNGSCEFT